MRVFLLILNVFVIVLTSYLNRSLSLPLAIVFFYCLMYWHSHIIFNVYTFWLENIWYYWFGKWEVNYRAVKKAIVLGDTGTIAFFYEKIIWLHGSEDRKRSLGFLDSNAIVLNCQVFLSNESTLTDCQSDRHTMPERSSSTLVLGGVTVSPHL